jgi:hypothetical protein
MCPQVVDDLIPIVCPLKSLKRVSLSDCDQMKKNEFSYDTTTCTVQTTLEPEVALRIVSDLNYTGPDDFTSSIQAVKTLTVTSEDGSFSLEKPEIVKRFTKVSRVLYVIRLNSERRRLL